MVISFGFLLEMTHKFQHDESFVGLDYLGHQGSNGLAPGLESQMILGKDLLTWLVLTLPLLLGVVMASCLRERVVVSGVVVQALSKGVDRHLVGIYESFQSFQLPIPGCY